MIYYIILIFDYWYCIIDIGILIGLNSIGLNLIWFDWIEQNKNWYQNDITVLIGLIQLIQCCRSALHPVAILL